MAGCGAAAPRSEARRLFEGSPQKTENKARYGDGLADVAQARQLGVKEKTTIFFVTMHLRGVGVEKLTVEPTQFHPKKIT
jgi:hypothetical protein